INIEIKKEVVNMQNNQYTFEQKVQFILGNIEHYEDFEEYSEANYNVSLEDFEESKADGFIADITCGVFNGATREFTPWEINEGNLINTIIQDIRDGDLYEMLEDYSEGTMGIDYALTYTEVYKVFTIGERSEDHTSELQSRFDLVCRLLLEERNISNENV